MFFYFYFPLFEELDLRPGELLGDENDLDRSRSFSLLCSCFRPFRDLDLDLDLEEES